MISEKKSLLAIRDEWIVGKKKVITSKKRFRFYFSCTFKETQFFVTLWKSCMRCWYLPTVVFFWSNIFKLSVKRSNSIFRDCLRELSRLTKICLRVGWTDVINSSILFTEDNDLFPKRNKTGKLFSSDIMQCNKF